jgi:hypothetical protein
MKLNEVKKINPLITQKDIKKITQLLIKKKKDSNLYNSSIEYKGLTFAMSISTFDNKPFSKKRVRIYSTGFDSTGSTVSADFKYLTPIEAGYTLKEVNDALKDRGFKPIEE